MTRLISGVAGGRRLKVPRTGVRPTGDRAREALFNSLTALVDLRGAARARPLRRLRRPRAGGAVPRGGDRRSSSSPGRGVLPVLRENLAAVGLPGAAGRRRLGAHRRRRRAARALRPGARRPAVRHAGRGGPAGAPLARRRRLAGARGRRRRRAVQPRGAASSGRHPWSVCATGGTARPRSGTVAPREACRLPRILRPGHQRSRRRHHPGRRPLRRARRRRAGQPGQGGPVLASTSGWSSCARPWPTCPTSSSTASRACWSTTAAPTTSR